MEQSNIEEIFKAAVSVVKPKKLIEKFVNVGGNSLHVKGKSFSLEKGCCIIGFGKAVLEMGYALEACLGDHLKFGFLSVPFGTKNIDSNSKIEVSEAAKNNIPDENSYKNALKIKNIVESINGNYLLIILISGGGSALLCLPRFVSLSEKQNIITSLSLAGATIQELNCVRKKLSLVKGGGLANFSRPTETISLILSDVIGDPLHVIASGPTVPNSDHEDAAFEILEKYNLRHLVSSEYSKEDFNHNHSFNFNHVSNFIIGNNYLALEAAMKCSVELGYKTLILSSSICGIAKEIAEDFAKVAMFLVKIMKYSQVCSEYIAGNSLLSKVDVGELVKMSKNCQRICLIAGGETTVKVTGNGIGGRNQEMALAFAISLKSLSGNENSTGEVVVCFGSLGTDGIDGPTDAAGAIVDWNLADDAKRQNLDPGIYLQENNSYTFFKNINNGKSLIKTGHTQTNVMDIYILTVEKR